MCTNLHKVILTIQLYLWPNATKLELLRTADIEQQLKLTTELFLKNVRFDAPHIGATPKKAVTLSHMHFGHHFFVEF